MCPGIGNYEESASGTTNGALSCYLIRHKLIDRPAGNNVALQSEQGFEMGRPGRINSEITIENDKITEVKVGGYATRFLEGKLLF